MAWLFWIWYAIGLALQLTIGVPPILDFSNALFLVFYALYALSLVRHKEVYSKLSDRSVSGQRAVSFSYLIAAAAIMWLSGMSLEWLGIHTGWPFGEYEYTNLLGSLVFGVPWTLGFAWISVVTSGILISSGLLSGNGANHRTVEDGQSNQSAVARSNWRYRMLRALLVGGWVIIMDLVLDPLAHASGFWHWSSTTGGFYGVPWSNFVAWFLIGGILSLTLPRLTLSRNVHRQAAFMYQAMLLMFGLLAWQKGIGGSAIVAVIGILIAEGSYRYDYRR